jgi:hypothetical protein
VREEPLRQRGVREYHDCPEREKLLYKRNENSKLLFYNLIERNNMFVMNDTNNKIGDSLVLPLMWEMSISSLEEMLLEDWNIMSDVDFIELNDIISFKKEWM